MICIKGEVGTHAFFLRTGSVMVEHGQHMSKTDEEVFSMDDHQFDLYVKQHLAHGSEPRVGSFFGEVSLLCQSKRTRGILLTAIQDAISEEKRDYELSDESLNAELKAADGKRGATIRAIEKCDMFALEQSCLDELATEFPKIVRHLCKDVIQRGAMEDVINRAKVAQTKRLANIDGDLAYQVQCLRQSMDEIIAWVHESKASTSKVAEPSSQPTPVSRGELQLDRQLSDVTKETVQFPAQTASSKRDSNSSGGDNAAMPIGAMSLDELLAGHAFSDLSSRESLEHNARPSGRGAAFVTILAEKANAKRRYMDMECSNSSSS